MHRSHPLYVAAALLAAMAIQLILMWRLRRGVRRNPSANSRLHSDDP
ncbi:hypothetical protein [Alicyclobacillus contaminans]|nr:hypothetical protein [Alicyclobacillus contaminans]